MKSDAASAELTPETVAVGMDGIVRQAKSGGGRFEAFLPSPVVQNHAANLMQLGNGDLGCVWFGGTMEGMGDISVYFSRLSGDRWSTPVRLSNDAERSEQNPVLFPAPDGRLWLLYTSQPSGRQDEAVVKCRISDDDGASFGPVKTLWAEPGSFVRQPITVDAQGDWLLPIFRCRNIPGQLWRGDDDDSAALVSRDAGASWKLREVPQSLGAVHMNIVPARDGDTLAFFRSRYADAVKLARSANGGLDWAAPESTVLPNNNSSVQAIRLADGAIAIVYNESSAATSSERRASLYDEIEGGSAATEKQSARPAIWGVPRAPLRVALSLDDGASFPYRRTIAAGSGYCLSNNSRDGLNREFSYPSIRQTADGALHVAFTCYRRAIQYVRITPDWVRAG
jgi:predicted neuraminidase